MRLIDLDEVINAIYSTDWYHLFNGELSKGAEDEYHALYLATDIYKAIGEVPVVDAEPVRHGRWIMEYETKEGRSMRCSECRMVFWVGFGRDGNYCPNCGAKMDGEQEKQKWEE